MSFGLQAVGRQQSEDTEAPVEAEPMNGVPSLRRLEKANVYIESGPTGRSAYWPTSLAFVHPDCATTDVALNRVDLLWLPHAGQLIRYSIELDADFESPLSEVAKSLRAEVDLPVSKIAEMCGIGRRQFYNLLDGTTAASRNEDWIRALGESVGTIFHAYGEDPEVVRDVLQRPVDGTTYVDAACEQDQFGLRSAHEAALMRIDSLPKRLHRSLPRKGVRRSPDAAEFFSDYREDDEFKD